MPKLRGFSLSDVKTKGNGDIQLMTYILHYLKTPEPWELWVYSFVWVMQDLYHQP